MTKNTRKRLKFLAEKLIKYGNEFRILSGDCEWWIREYEYKEGICCYENTKVDCIPLNCPLKGD